MAPSEFVISPIKGMSNFEQAVYQCISGNLPCPVLRNVSSIDPLPFLSRVFVRYLKYQRYAYMQG